MAKSNEKKASLTRIDKRYDPKENEFDFEGLSFAYREVLKNEQR
ncbi:MULTISPECIES: hypothetical protein [Aminobacterium]|nr:MULTISPECIES: hypothetical protein [Aminobacterium]